MQNPLQIPLNNFQKALDALKPVLLQKIGAAAVSFSKDNFRRQGFAGSPWAPRKNNKKSKGRAILINTGHLRNSIHIVAINGQSVSIGTDLPYARIHNEGGAIRHPYREVTMHYTGKSGKLKLGKITTEAQQRKISTTRRSSISNHVTNMPKRQFIGSTPELTKELRTIIQSEIVKTFRLIR